MAPITSLFLERDRERERPARCEPDLMEIEKDFLYINGRSRRTVIGRKKRTGRKSRKPRRRISITARLPFKRHRRSLRARIRARARTSGKIRCGKNKRCAESEMPLSRRCAIPPCWHGISFAINATGAVRPGRINCRAGPQFIARFKL